MADRFPLIVNSTDQQIQELASGDNLDLTGSGIVNAGNSTFAGNLDLGDNNRIRLGADDDLQIYHNGSDSYIHDSGTGDLILLANNLRVANTSGTNYITGISGGAVTLLHGGNAKLATSSAGVSITGAATFTDDLNTGSFTAGSTTTAGTNVLASGQINIQQASGSTGYFTRGFEGTTETYYVKADGSAIFAGPQTLATSSSPATNGYTSHIDNTEASTAACFSANNHNAHGINFLGVDGANSNAITCKIMNDGSATFNNTVTGQQTSNNALSAFEAVDTNGTRFKVTGAGVLSLYDPSLTENVQISSDGSATFASTIQSGGDPNSGTARGTSINQYGTVRAAQTTGTSTVFEGYTVGTSSATSLIKGDGSATFASYVESDLFSVSRSAVANKDNYTSKLSTADTGKHFNAKDTGGTTVASIDADGGATFGPLNISSSTGYGAQVDMLANAVTVKAQCQQTASALTLLYAGYQGTTRNFHVTAAGAGFFASEVVAGVRDSQGVFMTSGGALESFVSGSRVYNLGSNGSASFAGGLFSLAANGGLQMGSAGTANGVALSMIAGTSPAPSAYTLIQGLQSDGTTQGFAFKADGSVSIARGNFQMDTAGIIQTNLYSAGNVNIDSSGSFGSPKIVLNAANGTATFASQITIGTPTAPPANYAGVFYSTGNSGQTYATIYARNLNSSGRVWAGANNVGSHTSTIFGNGSASFAGAVSKGSGSFRIDHPLKPETHQLVHSFVEGPQADNIYRGKVELVDGTATVNIDTVAGMTEGTFAALNREIQCFTTNETGWTAIKGSVTGNLLTIVAQDNTCTDTISWLVIGERQDQHMYDTEWTDENGKVIVEPEKEVETESETE